MKKLYAPWRGEYLTVSKDRKKGNCPFCRSFSEQADDENYIILRSEHAVLMLNRYPYNGGHVMVLPKRHVPNIDDLKDDERNDLFALVSRATALVQEAFHPEGMNIGINMGAAGGGGLPEHLHVHIVPRWRSDTSFLTTVGELKVISVDLDAIFNSLKKLA